MIACICGGTLETALVLMGLGCLCRLLGKRGKKECRCDGAEHEEKVMRVLAVEEKKTAQERSYGQA